MVATANEIAQLLIDKLGLDVKQCTRVTLDMQAGEMAQLHLTLLVDVEPMNKFMGEVAEKYELVRKDVK